MALVLVGVLLGIALPAYGRYRDRARTSQAVSDITMMSALIQARWNDHRAYPLSLADIGMQGKLDPWGTPYVYWNIENRSNGRGGARKDKNINPINTDFDLYSEGPDQRSHSQISQKDSKDDIIRASNGTFVGVAADF